MARYYDSRRSRGRGRGDAIVEHRRDRFNDEHQNTREPESFDFHPDQGGMMYYSRKGYDMGPGRGGQTSDERGFDQRPIGPDRYYGDNNGNGYNGVSYDSRRGNDYMDRGYYGSDRGYNDGSYDSRRGNGYRDNGYNGSDRYDGYLARRTQEMEDGGMIREDLRAIANLPQEVMIKPYNRTGPYIPEGLDDTIRGVDGQMNYDDEKRREHFFPKKV